LLCKTDDIVTKALNSVPVVARLAAVLQLATVGAQGTATATTALRQVVAGAMANIAMHEACRHQFRRPLHPPQKQACKMSTTPVHLLLELACGESTLGHCDTKDARAHALAALVNASLDSQVRGVIFDSNGVAMLLRAININSGNRSSLCGVLLERILCHSRNKE